MSVTTQINLLATVREVTTSGPTRTSVVTALDASAGAETDTKMHAESGTGAATVNLQTLGFDSVSSIVVVCVSGSISLDTTGNVLACWPDATLTSPAHFVVASGATLEAVDGTHNQIRIGGTGSWQLSVTGI